MLPNTDRGLKIVAQTEPGTTLKICLSGGKIKRRSFYGNYDKAAAAAADDDDEADDKDDDDNYDDDV